MTSWSSRIKICFYKLIESIIKKKKMSWCETECKKKCAIGETECNETGSLYQDKELIRIERRDGGEGEERGLRKGVDRG